MFDKMNPDGDVQPIEAEDIATPPSDRLAELTDEIVEDVRILERGSVEYHTVWLRIGAKLAKIRPEASRGEWKGVLEKVGIKARVATNMMTLAKAGHTGETLQEAGGVNAALAALRPKPGRKKPESDSVFPPTDANGLCAGCGRPGVGRMRCERCGRAFEAMLPELKAAAKKGKGIRLSAAEVSALVDAVAWTAPPYGDWNGPEETFVGTGLAKRVLLGLALPGQMGKVLMKLHGAHPGFVPAEELREASGYTPTRFAAMMEVFHWRLATTKGYDGNERFFDWRHDDDSGVWECRLPDTVRRALEEAFPKTFPAPGSGMDEPGATAGSDANP